MTKAVAIFESGKTLNYEMKIIDLMIMKARIIENIERHQKLGMSVDKLVSFEVIK
uniref:Uncharacterized protein n=1 Tax=Siphoviridae sp. ctwDi18 TaxID=2827970 RepID=A0A8S5T9E6_9CAUD|nr:MAG TPA: hypothetical protein [Siphoviridae sp. ctwDi18]